MPLFMDRHDLPSVTAEDVAHAHARDLAVQGKHGVNFRTYWFDARTCCAFCLVEAPDAETAVKVHAEAHGLAPGEIIEVDAAMVEAFMGRINDPAGAAQGDAPIRESAHRVIMFTDIVNSTDMTARLGDVRAMDMVRAHDSLVRRALAAHGGREVKHLGDGMMAAFADAGAAIACAIAIQRAIAGFNEASSDPLYLRIGLHCGEPVHDNNDLFGAVVQLAARICDDAAIEAIVISEDLRALVERDFPVTALGRRMLKGFKQPMALFSVAWRA
ncbi:MAG: DUF4242 domain-containing protein [Terricaulis sp.]|nr:DUF4242 domain-containing protein [Terricaulis sp.]